MEILRLLFVLCWTLVTVLSSRLVRGPLHPGWSFSHEALAYFMRRETERTVRRIAEGKPVRALGVRLGAALRARLEHEKGTIAGVPVEIHTPRDWPVDGPVILYLHGGGYVSCSPGTHRELIARLAVAAGARCIAPDYRLAPAHAFPAGIDDCVAVYRTLLEEGVSAERIVVAGDSAGGGLTLALLQRAKEEGHPLPAGAVLLSPWVDLEVSFASVQENAIYDYLQPQALRVVAERYLQGRDPKHPLVSPLYADLSGLPPLLVHTGSAELFHDENHSLVERAREAGVEVSHHVEEGMVHVWHLFASLLPEARHGIRAIAGFVRAQTAVEAAGELASPAPAVAPSVASG